MLGISYVDEKTYATDAEVVKQIGDPVIVQRLLKQVSAAGEPWITGWSKPAFSSLLQEHSLRVVKDLCINNIEERYLKKMARVPNPS